MPCEIGCPGGWPRQGWRPSLLSRAAGRPAVALLPRLPLSPTGFSLSHASLQVNAIHENAEVFDARAEGVFKYLQVRLVHVVACQRRHGVHSKARAALCAGPAAVCTALNLLLTLCAGLHRVR